jgi:hypothetical protein
MGADLVGNLPLEESEARPPRIWSSRVLICLGTARDLAWVLEPENGRMAADGWCGVA